jgi:hypothetical protein
MKFEKLTIFTATETYGHDDNRGLPALDYVIPALESAMEPECTVLDYTTEEYTLVRKQQEEHGQEAQVERLRATAHGLFDQLDRVDAMHGAATVQRDALLKAAQAMDAAMRSSRNERERAAALTAIRAAIAAVTGEEVQA